MLKPFLMLVSRDLALLPKFAQVKKPSKITLLIPKSQECVAISRYNFGNILRGMQCTNAVNGGRIGGGDDHVHFRCEL